jgi:SAM-dependent methyltransferase
MSKLKHIIDKTVVRPIYLLRHKGNKYTCPFCGYKSDILNPFGEESDVIEKYHIIGAGRRNASCLKCGAHDRERLIFVYLKYVAKIFDGKTLSILHMAPEQKITAKILECHDLEYVCGDLFTEGYTYPDYVKNMNLLALPIENDRFDIVICNHVMEHIPEDTKAMSEIFRVLKPGGFAILQVPISYSTDKTIEDFSITNPDERKRRFGKSDHCRIYGLDYIDRLKSVGFEVDMKNISKDFPQFALNPEENIFICTKPRQDRQDPQLD